MKRNAEPIRTESYIYLTEDKSVNLRLSDMTDEQRAYVATALAARSLNAQFRGKAEFDAKLPPLEEVFPQLQNKEG